MITLLTLAVIFLGIIALSTEIGQALFVVLLRVAGVLLLLGGLFLLGIFLPR